MVAITVILAAVIGSYVFGMGPPKQAPELYFSDVTAYTDGNVSATVTGSGNVTIGSLKWLVQDSEVTPTSIYVNGVAGDANTYISGGDRITIVVGETAGWVSGQEIRVTISDVATGDLLLDVTVNVGSSSSS
jgi:FlaG/FlaF family flagellin (archaellin)